jgi:hypothetical protein
METRRPTKKFPFGDSPLLNRVCAHMGLTYPHDMYPFSDNVDEVPNFTAYTSNNKCAAPKILHAILLKTHNNIINMNPALINTLLSLIPMAFKLPYEQE